MTTTPNGHARRSERTRRALIDATIKCLVQDGYAGFSTHRVAAYAGTTRGALQHQYQSRADLVVEAVNHLATTAIGQVAAELTETGPSVERLVDRLWDLHRSDLFSAVLELWVGARTDPELLAAVNRVEADIRRAVMTLAGSASAAVHPVSPYELEAALATMRGLALRRMLSADPAAIDQTWRHIRPRLIASLGTAATDGGR